jgi:hypothetical protein
MTTFLFDLDGTLLAVDARDFAHAYFGELTRAFEGLLPSDHLAQNILTATARMQADTRPGVHSAVSCNCQSAHGARMDVPQHVLRAAEQAHTKQEASGITFTVPVQRSPPNRKNGSHVSAAVVRDMTEQVDHPDSCRCN